MALAYNTGNYLYGGKGRVYFKADGTTSWLDLGNVPKFEIKPEVAKEDHFSSRSGVKEKDITFVTEKKCVSDVELEEYGEDIMNLALLGDGVTESSQTAGTLSGTSITTVEGKFVDVNKLNLSYLKLEHGSLTGGVFAEGDTITVSAVSVIVVEVGTGYVGCIGETGGTIAVGDTITCSAVSATVTSRETINGAILADNATAASITEIYVNGTDYDVDAAGGMVRELPSSGIASHTAYIYADYALVAKKIVKALTNTSIPGALKFIGEPARGPKWHVEAWKVEVTPSGATGFIGDGITPIAMTIDILADQANHPSEPFFRATLME